MKKPIPDATQSHILTTAWDLIQREGRQDIGLSDIAAAAGVSRQTLFLAFGNRAGLLLAMVRHKDGQTDHVARLRAQGALPCTPTNFMGSLAIWLDYLPVVYPVAILLDAAGITETEAAQAINDRMKGALLSNFRRQITVIGAEGGLHPGANPKAVADRIWSSVHLQAWRLLVLDCGWSPQEFTKDRLAQAATCFPALTPD